MIFSDLYKRSVFGLLYVGVVLGSIFFGQVTFYIFLLLSMFICLKEFSSNILKLNNFYKIYLYVLSVGFFWVNSKYYLLFYNGSITIISILLSFSILIVYELFRGDYQNTLKNISNLFIAFIYIALPFSIAVKIPSMKTFSYSPEIITIFFISIWINDTFAYLSGSLFGKNKLFEKISPKKTIEGFIGGMIISFSLIFVFKYFVKTLTSIDILAIISVSVFFGTIGDLVESMFKRIANVKDSGNILPGHGGLLDRLDSFIFSVPFIYLFLFIINN